jgi:hypothetical protein
MKGGPEIPPWVAIVVVVLVVVVVGALIWRGSGKKTMSADQQAKMREIMKQQGFTLKGEQPPPGSYRPGMSSQALTPQQPPR